ncbi:MAG: hypothetical protein CR988_02280 [Treponema sp.]|nr:MAG: hypothetical protein CR988_02280 [Treponema sp.]
MENKEYIEIKDNIIIGHYCGVMLEKNDGITRIEIDNPNANVGDDVRLYSDLVKGVKKPLVQLIEEGLKTIPEGKKLNTDGTDFEDMTEAEKWEAGLIVLDATQWLEDDADYPRAKTQEELLEVGLISKNKYNEYISDLRKQAYQNEADPIFLQYQREEATKQEWLDKVAEIKQRYPKK